jgi:TPR repeat protein
MLLAVSAVAQQAPPAPLPPPIWDNAEAMLRLGNMYSRGEEVLQDEGQALRYYKRAAERGSAVASDNVATYYAMGRGTARDKVQALAWYRQAIARGYVPAMTNLGVLYSASFDGPPDYCQALAWFKKAAKGGNVTGMWHLGQAYQNGLCPASSNATLARHWLRKAVDIGRQPTASDLDRYASEQATQDLRKL